MSEPGDIWDLVDAHCVRLDAIEERLTRLDGETKTGRSAPDADPERCGCEQSCRLELELEHVRARLLEVSASELHHKRALHESCCSRATLQKDLEECRELLKQALADRSDLRVSLREAKFELTAAKDQAEGFRRQTESQRVGELQRALEDSRDNAVKHKQRADEAEKKLARLRDIGRS